MKLNKRSTALALALTALASRAVADPISYTFELIATSGPLGPIAAGYIIIDDALALSHGSGVLVAGDLEFNGTASDCPLGFGYQCGNDLTFPLGAGTNVHTPHSDAVVTFADGVPVAMSYHEQHIYDVQGGVYSELDIYNFALHPTGLAHTYLRWGGTIGSTIGTYAFGPQIAVVPEPETWALLLSGLVGIGASTRKRPRLTVRRR